MQQTNIDILTGKERNSIKPLVTRTNTNHSTSFYCPDVAFTCKHSMHSWLKSVITELNENFTYARLQLHKAQLPHNITVFVCFSLWQEIHHGFPSEIHWKMNVACKFWTNYLIIPLRQGLSMLVLHCCRQLIGGSMVALLYNQMIAYFNRS